MYCNNDSYTEHDYIYYILMCLAERNQKSCDFATIITSFSDQYIYTSISLEYYSLHYIAKLELFRD